MMSAKGRRVSAISLARGMLVVLGLFWASVAGWVLAGGEIGLDSGSVIWWIMVIGLFGDAAAMFLVAWGLGWKKVLFSILGFGLLAANGLLTLADQIGLLDLLTLLPHAAAFIALVLAMRRPLRA